MAFHGPGMVSGPRILSRVIEYFFMLHILKREGHKGSEKGRIKKKKMIDKKRDFGFRFCHYTKIDVVDFLCSPVEIQKFTLQDFRWEYIQIFLLGSWSAKSTKILSS
jgi:hypothetical protein